ncbi:MAG: hypothetical protein WCR72_14690 [Bacteroidota bacterium]
MSNTSLYRISSIHTPFILRSSIRLTGLIRVFITYLQYLLLRQELFIEDTTLKAYMTPQVCYLEKLLKMHISPEAVIDPKALDVTLFREDETSFDDLYITDTDIILFYTDAEFGLDEFTIILPLPVSSLVNYARELLNAYKLPGKIYTIILR